MDEILYAWQERALEEAELEDDRRLELYCATYDELRELRMWGPPDAVLRRERAARAEEGAPEPQDAAAQGGGT